MSISVDVAVDIDLDDIYDQLSDKDRGELVEWLAADGYIAKGSFAVAQGVSDYIADQIRRIKVSGFDRPAIEVLEEIEEIINDG